jgi:hypothetical protein
MTAIKPDRKFLLPPINRQSYIPIAFFTLAGTQILLLLAFLYNTVSISKIANEKQPTLVQMVNGQSVVAEPYTYDYRDPKILQNAAQQWVALTYSWGFPRDSELMPLPGKDLGSQAGSAGSVPLTSGVASHLLTPDARDEFMNGFAGDIFSQAQDGNYASNYRPIQMLAPEKTDNGWKIEILGERHITTPENAVGLLRPVHLEIYLIATEPSSKPVVGDATPLEKEVYALLQSGVRIEKVVSLGS